jgi:hypothetical protein
VSDPCRPDAHGQTEGVGQEHQGGPIKALDGADAEGGAAGRRADQGLHQLPPAPLQEAQLQEPPQHLPPLSHTPPLQHSVSGQSEFTKVGQ